MTAKVSIVITNYNGADIVGNAIRSVYDNYDSYKDFELIVVDDGSKDNSLESIEQYVQEYNKNDIPTLVQGKENGGTASARNLGVQLSSSPIIGFLDSDDVYLGSKIEKSVNTLEKHKVVGIAYSDYISTTEDGSRQYVAKPSYSYEKLMLNCIISTNSFIKRDAFDSVGGFDESIKIIEDYDLWLRICSSGWVAHHIPESLFIYADLPNNKTNSEMSSGGEKFSRETHMVKKRILEGDNLVLSS